MGFDGGNMAVLASIGARAPSILGFLSREHIPGVLPHQGYLGLGGPWHGMAHPVFSLSSHPDDDDGGEDCGRCEDLQSLTNGVLSCTRFPRTRRALKTRLVLMLGS